MVNNTKVMEYDLFISSGFIKWYTERGRRSCKMKLIDQFFETILTIQCYFERLEIKIEKYKKYNKWIFIGSIFVVILSFMARKIIFGNIIFISAMILLALENIIGCIMSVPGKVPKNKIQLFQHLDMKEVNV